MDKAYSLEALLEFLSHVADRGLMPSATAQALAVASRKVFGVLDDQEMADLRKIDVDRVTQRFTNKRASDYSPRSLRAYSQRVPRALELFFMWRDDPANFAVETRSPRTSRAQVNQNADHRAEDSADRPLAEGGPSASGLPSNFYQTSFPVRPGVIVTVSNLPRDLTVIEAGRLTEFIRLLAFEDHD